jgi:glycine/D-amino acid oxidase-like deaminating enzyme
VSIRPQLPETADVVVMGAGLAGAATAHALGREDRFVLMLERRLSPGAESSGRSASMVREDVGDDALRALATEGAAIHRTSRLATFRPTGSFLLGRGDEDIAARIPRARGVGRFFPGDGVVATEELLRSFLAGQALVTGVSVLRIERGREGVVIVTDAGVVEARIAVNAAGAWAGRIGDLPLVSRKRHLFVSAPSAIPSEWPFAWDDANGYYFRPEREGLLLCACDQRETEPGDNGVDPTIEGLLRAKLQKFQPGLLPLEVRDSWAGQRTFAPDGRFVIGWDARIEGLFHVAAFGGHGVTVSPAVGRLAASMILAGPDREIPEIARPLSPARFMA